MAHTYGYARISSKDRHEDRQVIALKNFGVDVRNIFVDRKSSKDFDRPEYRKLLRRLKADDVLVVKSIDRLGRNYAEILDQWCRVTKDKDVAIVVIDTPILDTRRDRTWNICRYNDDNARGVYDNVRHNLTICRIYGSNVISWSVGRTFRLDAGSRNCNLSDNERQ